MTTRVRSSGGCGAALLWILATAWAATIVFFVRTAGFAMPTGAWIGLAIFVLAGIWLAALAVRATASAIRFRGTTVELRTDPGILGGSLAGIVHLRRPAAVQLTLSNWRRDDSDELLWESMPLPLGDGVDLPFAFDVPVDCEPTSSDAYWRVLLESRDHAASFTVPVAGTDASSPAQTRQALRAASYEAPAKTKVTVERGASSTTVRLPLPSWLRLWYTLVLVIAAGAYLCATVVWPQDTATIAFIGIATTLVLCAIPLPTLAMTVRSIDADGSGLTLHFAAFRRARRIAPCDVGARYATGALHYELTFAGAVPPWTIVTLRSRAEAEWVAYELRRASPQRA